MTVPSSTDGLTALINSLQTETEQNQDALNLKADLAKLLEALAAEFLDNTALKDQAKKDRAANIEKLLQLIEAAINIGGEDPEMAQVLNQCHLLASIQKRVAELSKNLDLSIFSDPNIIARFETFIDQNNLRYSIEQELTSVGIIPDNVLTGQIIDVIDSIDKNYQEPYQQVAEILADMYNQFSDLNGVVSAMIGHGTVNPDNNNITIDLTALEEAVNELNASFTDPNSEIVQALQAITFTEEELEKGTEMVSGTGLQLSSPPAPYHLEVNPNILDNLNEAYASIKKGYPSAVITTYQLQSFQTALDSQSNYLSSSLQTGTEKYQQMISMADNFAKLVSTFIQSNAEANKSFLS